MRTMSVMRFVVFGAVGFGVGAALAVLVPALLPLAPLIAGSVGGASLGLALKDFRRVGILALLGALGLSVGLFAGLALGSLINYSSAPMGALVGAVVGASLGVAFRDWRVILVLAVAGAVGIAVGLLAGDFLRASFPIIRGVGSIAVAGLVGGASLGAALGYLQHRKLAERQRPRVR